MSQRRTSLAVKRARADARIADLATSRHLVYDLRQGIEFDKFNDALRDFRALTDPPLVLISPYVGRQAMPCTGRRLNRIGCDMHGCVTSVDLGAHAIAIHPHDCPVVLRVGDWLEARGVVFGLQRYARIPEPLCSDAMAPELLAAAGVRRLF